MKKITTIILAACLAAPLIAQDNAAEQTTKSNINQTDSALFLRLGLGYGSVVYGSSNNNSTSELGGGPSFSGDAAVLWNWKLVAAELSFVGANISNTEVTVNGVTTKNEGSGFLWFLDPKIGVKLFSKPGDMGHTFLYGGLRVWGFSRSLTSTETSGVKTTYSPEDKTSGSAVGWIAGVRDLSTYKLGSGDWSLLFQWGVFVDSAPLKEVTENDSKVTLQDPSGLGLGYEVGLGAANENSGLAIYLNYKVDVAVTLFDSPTKLFGTGIGHYYLTVAKQLDL
ncbi:MAG: hypothetical protein D6767_00855 [Candidatus Hydrogenedentota bacterium]|nr:MAG: hypothetical protein D6767_00855 [Candidatus Hydrogenedentota bacterium]